MNKIGTLLLSILSSSILGQTHHVTLNDSSYFKLIEGNLYETCYVFNDSLEDGKWILHQTHDYSDTVFENNFLNITTFSSKLRNGWSVIKYISANDIDSIQYKDDLLNGQYLSYQNGDLVYASSYLNGKLHGISMTKRTLHPNIEGWCTAFRIYQDGQMLYWFQVNSDQKIIASGNEADSFRMY